MISSKVQWGGMQSDFNELKQLLIEGYFKGHGASYNLVNWKFLETYDTHGYKVLRFFP